MGSTSVEQECVRAVSIAGDAMSAALSRRTLRQVPANVTAPKTRGEISVGIVHFGPGAFHRAHQAAFVDALLDTDSRWGIAAVALRNRATIDALSNQDGLYTLAVRDAEPSYRVIDAHRRFLGPGDAADIEALLTDPAVALVTMTVTEKGYYLGPDALIDLGHEDIVADLSCDAAPRTVIGWLARGLSARRNAGVSPFAILSCDNVPENGTRLKRALVAFARERDPLLADWIDREVLSPNTMVDAITPASDQVLTVDVGHALGGLTDRAAVQREAYAQWVIEDCGRSIGPDLTSVGAIVTKDIAAFELAKLRLLNASHSALAYVGLLRGHTTVAEAMIDVSLSRFIERMMAKEIAPGLPAVDGLDIGAYQQTVLARFANPTIAHRLDQIAQDGSLKLSFRFAETLRTNLRERRASDRILATLGCWIAFLIDRARNNVAIADPAGAALQEIACSGDAWSVAAELARQGLGLPTELAGDGEALDTIAAAATRALINDWSAMDAA